MSYTPPKDVLEKYAKLLVNFALGGGTGIKPGQVVCLSSPVSALLLYRELQKAVIDAGGTIISNLTDDMGGTSKYLYKNASDKQLKSIPKKYFKGLVDQIDHEIKILGKYDPHELDNVDPEKMMIVRKASKVINDWVREKEDSGRLSWTLALYGTSATAKQANMNEKEYWEQIINACYLDKDDPISEWKTISSETMRVAQKLTSMRIENVHIQGPDADLKIKVGKMRRWEASLGPNIPSFEVFTSPDWRGTEGWIRFNQPLHYFGPMVEGIELHFSKGKVIKSSATTNERLLKAMLNTDSSSAQLGEFSLTDKRLSRITKFMAESLFDENMGGEYGNTHIAVGESYHGSYSGDLTKLSKVQYEKLGFNNSSIHVDMISTTDRTVTATLADGSKTVIYSDGQFRI